MCVYVRAANGDQIKCTISATVRRGTRLPKKCVKCTKFACGHSAINKITPFTPTPANPHTQPVGNNRYPRPSTRCYCQLGGIFLCSTPSKRQHVKSPQGAGSNYGPTRTLLVFCNPIWLTNKPPVVPKGLGKDADGLLRCVFDCII